MRRLSIRWLVLALSVLGAIFLGFVAGRSLGEAVPDKLVEPAGDGPLTVRVVEHEFGREIPLPLRLEWPLEERRGQLLPGVVTTVGESLSVGDDVVSVPVRVSMVPVFAFSGEVPAYRDLRRGVEGPDVLQLQRGLARVGLLSADAVDGKFGAGTDRAVRELMKRAGGDYGGVLPLGSVLFVPEDAVMADDDLIVGGDSPGFVRFTRPTSTVPSVSGRVGRVPGVKPGLLAHWVDEGVDLEVVAVHEVDGEFELTLRDAGGDTCLCDIPAPRDGLPLRVEGSLELVPAHTGLAVPVAAVTATGDGGSALVDPQGETLRVSVVGVSDGLAEVEPVDGDIGDGTEVLIEANSG